MHMFRRPSRRFLTTFLVVVSLLFSQLALANYVCPGEQDMAAMAEMMAAGEPCEGMDAAQPVLCHQYSASAAQAVEQLKVVTPTLPALVQVLFLPVLNLSAQALALPVSAEPEVRPPPDPLFLSTLRLRV
ncbi:hypothetical protein [Caenimonas soli]|uniref:hypothetical protein n=1 Tax=Caenimonas soli TaxID=2735555 RepID=UPI00155803BF|nr:hypothetical protein [Caenimonas soli]